MLSENLRKIRKEHKLTQQNIADILGVDRTTYTFYELGTTTPSPSTLYKLSKIYNVTVGYIMGVEKNNPDLKIEDDASFVADYTDSFLFLTNIERELISNFRLLDLESKKKIIEYVRNYSSKK